MTFANSIYVNGQIATLDAEDAFVEATAVADGVIIARGANEEIHASAGKGTEVIDRDIFKTPIEEIPPPSRPS